MGLRSWILPGSLAVIVTALALPSRASTITFNPLDNGNGAGAITGVSGFGYATTSVLADGTSSPGTPNNPNTTPFQVYYESVINATQGTTSTIGSNFSINGSTNQFTVIASFTEQIVGFSPTGSLTFGLVSPAAASSTNFFEILANPTSSGVNPSTGTGANFGSGTPILTGFFTGANFGGSFSISLPTLTTPGPFNTSGLPSAINSALTNNGTSVAGGGGTQLTVQVTTANAGYFPVAPAQLLFSTTNSLPFASVAPLSGFYTGPGAAPQLTYAPGNAPGTFDPGTSNAGGTGNSTMFQSVATSSFAVPEPGSLIMAATAALGIPMVLSLRRRRSKNSVV
jgi:hypothetical protein